MANRKYNSQRKLGFQQLEDRRLMAANVLATAATPVKAILPAPAQAPVAQVSAYLAGGKLTITGDKNNDAVTISQPAYSPNEIVLTSTNGTLLNGQTKLDFKNVTGDIDVTFKGVAESLTVGTGTIVLMPANFNVNMGNGTNNFQMLYGNIHGSMSLTGGSGTDYVGITNSRIGSSTFNGGANDLTLMLGGGVNGIRLQSSVIVERDLNILDPSSAGDTITLVDNVTAGRYVYINAGNASNCNNNITLAGVTAGGQLNIQTGGGVDSVRLGGAGTGGQIEPVLADSVYADLGAGNDFLQIGGTSGNQKAGGVLAQHGTTYLGGAGNDSLWNEGLLTPLSGVSGFEVIWVPAH